MPVLRVVSMYSTDILPDLVQSFVTEDRDAEALLSEILRHVGSVSRRYPASYFALGQKTGESVDDLGHRVFTSCASIEKGRFPFSGRPPFVSYVEEDFDGRTIRYHSFYAKLSITREILRDDYAFNIRRNPTLRWRAELYTRIGDVLKATCESVPQGRGVPPKWQIAGSGLRALQPLEVVEARMKQSSDRSVEGLVRLALELTGGLSQSRLTHLLETVLDPPAVDEPDVGHESDDPVDRMGIRQAVSDAWEALEAEDRSLVIALSRGASYEELTAADPRLGHKVAVSRAVSRVGRLFLQKVVDQMGGEAAPNATPRSLMEPVIAVLAELYPNEFERGE